MGFLDNLENDLKNLENAGQGREGAEREQKARQQARADAQAAAPHAEALKSSPFTSELLKQAARVGFAMRTKVHIAWLGSTLRLEARERRLELRPTASGVVAAYIEGGSEVRTEPLDLGGNPEEFVRAWLSAG
jgi:hypothetical protein